MIRLALLAFSLGCLGACSSAALRKPIQQLRQGPASNVVIRRVVAVPSTCGSFLTVRDPNGVTSLPRCKTLQLETVDALLRVEFDFRGFDVVNAAKVNATTFSRLQIINQYSKSSKESVTTRSGSTFADVTPAMQDRVIEDLDADGLLLSRIWLGAGIGISLRHEVMVQIALIDTKSDELVWARRCSIETIHLDEKAILDATRCAMATKAVFNQGDR